MSNPFWTTDIAAKRAIKADDGKIPITIPKQFHETVSKYKDSIAMSWRVPIDAPIGCSYNLLASVAQGSRWESWTWKQVEDETYRFAGACLANGLEKKGAVVVMGYNTPQWLFAFHGVIQAGGVIAGSYLTNNEETCCYLAKDSGAQFVLAESYAQGRKFIKVLDDEETALVKIIVWGDDIEDANGDERFVSFKAFIDSAPDNSKELVTKVEETLDVGECCDLIYTSGTTGNPKGVMLSHDNLTWDALAGIDMIEKYTCKKMESDQVFLSYLPLSHISAQLLDFLFAAATGGSIWFATPDALKGGLLPLLQQTRPTFFFGVPRVWEKIKDAMTAKSVNNSWIKSLLIRWAKESALKRNLCLAKSGGTHTGDWGIAHAIYNMLVYKKVKTLLGLERCNILGSGAAPISEEVLSFYWGLDIHVIEGFGMSETTGLSTVSFFPRKVKLGSVGSSLLPNLIRIGKDGEIQIRGRHIMMGYLNKEEKTAATFTEDGYLRSGDVGKLDDDGFLKITGRIKELLITAGGENVPPVPIETAVKEGCGLISNAVLIGNKRKYLSMLITLRVVLNMDTLEPTDQLDQLCLNAAEKIGSTAKTIEEAQQDPKVFAAIQASIDAYNAQATSRAQKVQKFVILNTDFSVPGGELTGTQKLKRPIVMDKYADEVESMYS
jgi:long-chain-fatty-acid--CoA ligase ACSBG